MIKYTYKDLSPEVLINQEERKTKMNYQIAICDDEYIICNLLKELVKRWAKKNNLKVKIQTFSSAESFLFTYEEDKGFDIFYHGSVTTSIVYLLIGFVPKFILFIPVIF
jgi:hypothetical protein